MRSTPYSGTNKSYTVGFVHCPAASQLAATVFYLICIKKKAKEA